MNELLQSIIDVYPEEDLLIAEGFDDAVIGIDPKSLRLIYSITKYINILMKNDDMDYDTAIEYFDFNVLDAYVGEKNTNFL